MKDKKNITAQSEDIIKKYLSGKLTGKERNAFEKELLKDKFLEEAMEGFLEISPEQYGNDLKKLEKRFKRRTGKTRKVLYYRIAASVAILIAASVFIIIERDRSEMVFREEAQMEIAMNQPILKQEDAVDDKAGEAQYNVKSEPSKEERKAAAATRETTDFRNITVTDDVIVPDSKPEELESAGKEVEESVVLPSENRKDTESIARIPEKVMSPAAAGSKSIRSYDTSLEAKKENENMPAGSIREDVSDGMKITLFYNGDMLSDFAGKTGKDENIPPEPSSGIEAFISYFRGRISAVTINDTKDKVIEAGFRVLTDGSIDNIKIKTPSGKYLTDEVTRIIMEGPYWKAAVQDGVPVKGDVTLRIEFN